MFFKRLELQGFKSFGHRTVIDFQEGFTIVVGPNGCGKSNVLDGIRWVLGETSAKALRGGRMGDVVFRGSQSMKPAGLASVTLTVNNSAGTLKLDQPEVSVTRRLFSNGDSEYQLNKVTCRMRDVHELFLDTGLGADGYSVIEQGQIGQMVAAKPDQRREIFEEAAGISRYKMRREETVRKLQRTTDDLTRLFDLVGEVERQCNSLKYQARKAQRHRRLTKRLHRLQQRLIVLRHRAASEEYAKAEASRNAAQAAFEQAAAQAAQADANVAVRQEKQEALQAELQKLQQKRYETRQALDRERHQAELLGQQVTAMDERMVRVRMELDSRASRLTIMSGTMQALERDLAEEESRKAASEAELREKTQRLEILRRENDAQTQELARMRAELGEARARENVLSNDKRVAESLVQRLEDELGQTEFQIRELSEQIARAEAALEEHRQRSEENKALLAKLRAEAQRVQEEIGRDDKAKKELGERLDSLTRDLNQATSRLQALKELEENFEGYFQGVRQVMLASTRREVTGVVGVVSSMINVPKNLEIAVEVALGSDLQDIIMASVEDAKQAIGFLKRRNLGRATFLPLDFLHWDFNTNHLDRIWGRPGVLGLGRDLVQFDSSIKPAVYYLFGSTVFVETLDVAVELERDGVRNRYVSLGGDVVNPRGVLSGGSHQTRGLLTRQREIRQLAERVGALEGDLGRLREEMRQTKDRLGALYARAAELQTEVHSAQMREATLEKDLQQAERERRERRNQHASVEARGTQQRLDRIRQGEVIENCEKGIAALTVKIADLTSGLQTRESGAADRLDRLQKLSEDVAVSREADANLAGRARALRERLGEMRTQIEESERERHARAEELAKLEQDRGRALQQRDESEAAIGDLAREHEAAENAAGDRAAENESLAAELRAAQSEAQRLARDRNERDNHLREAQLKATELKAQLDYIQREAEDEFALTIDEIIAELAAAEGAERERLARIEEEKERAKAAKRKPAGEDQPAEGDAPVEEAPAEAPAAKTDDEEEEDDEPATTPEDDLISDPSRLRALVTELRQKLQRMGAVNEAAIEEYAKAQERFQFLTVQRDDLVSAKTQLEDAIRKIDETTTQLFNDALENIKRNFSELFRRLFNGGSADLVLVEDEKYPEPGIDIYAQPPGKKIGGSITLMSGGEKALTAIALMFALFQYRPSPICVLDEVDAPLDDVNVGRMCDMLRSLGGNTQFLIITHNKITMSLADTIYGVTMQEPGVSKVVSVRFDEVEDQGLLETAGTRGE